jgi:polysaccharide biosynthesis/export protein
MKVINTLCKTGIGSLLALIFVGCASNKEILYYQNAANMAPSNTAMTYDIKIQPDDMLMIIVSAEDPEVALPFNITTAAIPTAGNASTVTGQQSLQYYLVDKNGNIDFPILGKLQVGGQSRTKVMDQLRTAIGAYIKNPIINLRIMNFKIAVQGEVNAPGIYEVPSERITLIEALSWAKDLTIYGKRNNILVIRDHNGQKSFHRIDITKADFVNSPFYYLAQNDVVYVEPNKTKVNSAAIGPNTSVIISAISILVSLSVLIFK